jgi:glyoxylase-like metal-dependent hydrolase (beta-lactamase superfamily II)
MRPLIQRYREDLVLVALPAGIPGFERFIGVWVYLGGPVAVIDVGPMVSAPVLLSALTELGVERPDAILLTHIHIDHAGGLGTIARAFPQTPIACHPKGVSHLVEPAKLWQGSLKTLGDLAVAYGPMEPVPEQQVISTDEFGIDGIRAVLSPGHAAHHVSYFIGELLFAGEAGGVCLPTEGGGIYLRPATPPPFFMETSLASIDNLLDFNPQTICYGHLNLRKDAGDMLRTHRRQLQRWHEMLVPLYDRFGGRLADALEPCIDHLLANDPLLKDFHAMSADDQSRERYFLRNSVRGYWGYIGGSGDKLRRP